MLEYHDCISINEKVYSKGRFQQVMDIVTSSDKDLNLGCTEFELLTATAFKIFEIEKIDLALVEVGLGGRLDATNVLQPWLGSESGGLIAAGITRISYDHEGILGNTLPSIAREKAGIIKDEVPVVVDSKNPNEVLEVIEKASLARNSHMRVTSEETIHDALRLITFSSLKGRFQIHNLAVALELIEISKPQFCGVTIDEDVIKRGIQATKWPGRLQLINLTDDVEILIDGAHNENAALELKAFLEDHARTGIVYILGFTKGKNMRAILQHLLSDKDAVITYAFSKPECMPWINCSPHDEIAVCARSFGSRVFEDSTSDVASLIRKLSKLRSDGDRRPIVACGSLYLCADLLRHIKQHQLD